MVDFNNLFVARKQWLVDEVEERAKDADLALYLKARISSLVV